ncbi:hypothetical protein ACG33_07505 [Steroidobacter denitrificans]|uniref:Response regulatory domain-containing protein n=1 Tax=Steroidobacter denitrificans TaxID=465721 RepID=A0A127F947_STEDE|nr:response regulator [Steroidobacter denitrificans]AMN46944.1 hypothetical protein ACG33_07505 [Steroidobacter denitrificans]
MKNILILDDDATVLRILSGVLSSAGHVCHESTNPDTALATLTRKPQITVVLSDYYMPEMNGLEFVQHVMALDRPTPYVLLVTAQPSIQMVVEAMRLGVCDFLSKPTTPAEIVEAIGRVKQRATTDRLQDRGAPDLGELIRRTQNLAAHLQRLASAENMLSSTGSSPIGPVPLLQTMDTFRELRTQCIVRERLDEAAWDMLMELASAQRRGQRLSVSGLMVSGSNVSATTLLRRVNNLVEREFIARTPDSEDARRHFVDLTPKGHALVSGFLAKLGEQLYPRTVRSGDPSCVFSKASTRSAAVSGR